MGARAPGDHAGVVRPETPRERRSAQRSRRPADDLLSGKPLPIRARHFRPAADVPPRDARAARVHAAAARIEQRTEQHEAELRDAWYSSPPRGWWRGALPQWFALRGGALRRGQRPDWPAQPVVSGRIAPPMDPWTATMRSSAATTVWRRSTPPGCSSGSLRVERRSPRPDQGVDGAAPSPSTSRRAVVPSIRRPGARTRSAGLPG